MSNIEIEIIPELAGTALVNLPYAEVQSAKKDTNGFLKKINIDTKDLAVKIVENTDKRFNLCLPYYSHVESRATAAGESEMQAGGGFNPSTVRHALRGETSDERHARNAHQIAFNIRMALTYQYHRIDHQYDGYFDVDSNPTHIGK